MTETPLRKLKTPAEIHRILARQQQQFAPQNNSAIKPVPRKTGRPSKLTLWAVKRILKCVRRGLPLKLAAQAGGMSPMTLYGHRDRNERFAAMLAKAVARGVDARLKVVEHALNSPDENIRLRAATWMLSHDPVTAQYFSEARRVEISGADDSKVVVLSWPHQSPQQAVGGDAINLIESSNEPEPNDDCSADAASGAD